MWCISPATLIRTIFPTCANGRLACSKWRTNHYLVISSREQVLLGNNTRVTPSNWIRSFHCHAIFSRTLHRPRRLVRGCGAGLFHEERRWPCGEHDPRGSASHDGRVWRDDERVFLAVCAVPDSGGDARATSRRAMDARVVWRAVVARDGGHGIG